MYACYHMCHAKSLDIYLFHRIYSVMNYSSVTRYSVTYSYTLQACHVKLSMPSVTCISCHVRFTVTCYTMLWNVVCYMVCHVTKCCMLHVCHVMKCSLLHLCLEVYHVYCPTFMSRYVTSRFCLLCHVHVTSRYEMSCLPVKSFMSITTLSARMG